jgi:hypothetical protein
MYAYYSLTKKCKENSYIWCEPVMSMIDQFLGDLASVNIDMFMPKSHIIKKYLEA